MTALPPFQAGAVHDTSAEAESLAASTVVGASGTVAGVPLAGADGYVALWNRRYALARSAASSATRSS